MNYRRRFLKESEGINIVMKNFSKKSLQHIQGFTIVETLVAIAILMISIAGPLTIAQKGLTAAVYARDQVVASYLAQDQMEFLKNARDNSDPNNPKGWLGFFSDEFECDGSTNFTNCISDTTSNTNYLYSCQSTSGTCPLYHQAENDNLIGYHADSSGGVSSQFSIGYTVKELVPNAEARITVTVSWKNGVVSNSIILENLIFNIRR